MIPPHLGNLSLVTLGFQRGEVSPARRGAGVPGSCFETVL